MRMRKKKWALPYLEEHHEVALSEPTTMKGQWRKILGCDVLHVEIGMGKGDYLIKMHEMYPDEGWVGIEKDQSAAAVACRKIVDDENIGKKRMIVGDATEIDLWFEENEIDVIHLNFSDPWPKKYTHKRRLSSEKFLEKYKILLKPTGMIRMKTDNKDLFEDSILYFLQGGFKLSEISVDYRRHEHPEDAITEYEQRYLDLDQPIYQLVAVLPNE